MALDCPGCQRELCKDPGPCRFGKTLDVCGCCTACYKVIAKLLPVVLLLLLLLLIA